MSASQTQKVKKEPGVPHRGQYSKVDELRDELQKKKLATDELQKITHQMKELYSQQLQFHAMLSTAREKFKTLQKKVDESHKLAINREQVIKKLTTSTQRLTDAVEEDINLKYLPELFKLARAFEKTVSGMADQAGMEMQRNQECDDSS